MHLVKVLTTVSLVLVVYRRRSWAVTDSNAEGKNLIKDIKQQITTSMSSVDRYNRAHTSWNSSNAIDGHTGDPYTCGCCSGTFGEEPPWWQLDLGKKYLIDKIIIIGECSLNTFGANCEKSCQCANGTSCHHSDGYLSCDSCSPGWRGRMCSDEYGKVKNSTRSVGYQEEQGSNSTKDTCIIVGSCVFAAIVVLVVTLGIILYRTQTNRKRIIENDYSRPDRSQMETMMHNYDTVVRDVSE